MTNSSNNKRKWTVLVCLAGDNNLSIEMIYNIKEMKRVEKISPDGPVTVIVLFDPAGGLPTQSYVINGGQKVGDIDNQLIAEAKLIGGVKKIGDIGDQLIAVAKLIGGVEKTGKSEESAQAVVITPEIANSPGVEISGINTGDPETLIQLINQYFNEYHAEHYLLVLSGHGSGADQDFLLTDDSAKDSLNISELKKLISGVNENLSKQEPARKLDILGLDSCLMSMAEVYYQLGDVHYDIVGNANANNLVDFLVGAEGFVRSTGWPYQRVLTTLTEDENKNISPEEFAKKIVEDYILYYSDYTLAGQSVDLAACDLRGINCPLLKEKVKVLAKKLKDNLKDQAIKDALLLAHWEAQSYKFDQYTDLLDFCELLAKRCSTHQEIKAACDGVVDAIRQKIVIKSCHTGPAVQYSNGLSVYFPWSRVSLPYENLQFAKDTLWHEFLKEYVKETRRPPRKECAQDQTGKASVKNQIFNPEPEELTILPDGTIPPGVKFVAPFDMFVAPFDMGQSDRISSMKNPPIKWCPENCGD